MAKTDPLFYSLEDITQALSVRPGARKKTAHLI